MSSCGCCCRYFYEEYNINRKDVDLIEKVQTAMLNYACEAGEAGKAGDGSTAAFTAGGAAKMTRAVR